MNLNEVKKHVYFNIILYAAIGICFILSLIAILATPVSAASELKQYDITNTIRNTAICGTASSGYYCTEYQGGSDTKRSVNTSYSTAISSIIMDVSVNTWFTSAPSTIEIYNSLNSFANVSYTCSLTTLNSNVDIPCSVVRVNSGRLNINFNTSLYTPYMLSIYSNNGFNTIASNFNINRVVLLETVGSDNSDVINNANQNTADVINNANQNTTDIINNNDTNTSNLINNSNINFFNLEQTMKSMMATVCQNKFNWNGDFVAFNRAVQQVAPEGSVRMAVTNSSYAYLATVIKVEPNTRYYVRTLSKSSNANYKGGMSIRAMPSLSTLASFGGTSTSVTGYTGAINGYFDSGDNNQVSVYLFVTDNTVTSNNIQYDTIMISKVQGEAFCPFGSVTANKLDDLSNGINGVQSAIEDTNDKLQDTYDFISDNSSPTVPTSDINNVISTVQIQDPLNYLLTLPINLLAKLNTLLTSGSCNRVVFGSLYGTELYLPCIDFESHLGSSLWSTIDVIAGIGLLVIIIKRFYDSISNILTLGKEKEVRDKLELPTPMEFLSMILGGGR